MRNLSTIRRATAAAAAILLPALPVGAQARTHVTALPTPSKVHGVWEGLLQRPGWPPFVTLTVAEDPGRTSATLEILGQVLRATDAQVRGDSLAMRIGSDERAVLLDGTLRDGRLVGVLRQGGQTSTFSLRGVPAYPKPRDRVEAWAQDIDALATRFLEHDRSFSPAERAMFLELLDSTRRELPVLHDDQVIARMARAIALGRNAHSRLYLVRNATELRRLPVRVWWFSDGLRIVRATPAHRDLLGCRVDRIGGALARHARDMVAPAFAGNPQWVDYKSAYTLTSAELLHGMGVTRTADSASFTVSDCPTASAGRHVVLKPLPLVKRSSAVEAWWDLSPRHPGTDTGWVHVLDVRRDDLPLYLRNPAKHYWFEYVPASGTLYVQYTRSQNMQGETVAQFGERLLAALEQHRPRAFALDLRFNTGGNMTLADALMKELVQRTAGIPRYVIVGRATFSAGISAAVPWAESGNASFVGEPVGDDLDYWSEGGNVRLPNAGYKAHFANGMHNYSLRSCPEGVPCEERSVRTMEPDVVASLSWSEYLAGRDPAMEAVRVVP